MTRKWWQRQRAFLDFCLASLLRRRGKNGALLGGYALIVFMLTSVLFFAGSLQKEAAEALRDAPEIVVQRMVTGRYAPIPLDYRDAIQTIRGVRQVAPRFWGYYFHPAVQANFTVIARDDDGITPGSATVGAGVARIWPVEPGGQMVFRTHDGHTRSLTATAQLPAEAELVSADLILVHPGDFEAIFGLDSRLATDLVVAVRNPNEVQTVAEKITRQLPDARPVLRDEILRTYAALFDWRSGYVLVMLAGAAVAFFIFALDKATGLSAEERSEIAVLKAIGWDTADVLALKFYEGLVISLSAFLLGGIAAYLHVYWTDATLFEHAIRGWGVLYPELKPVPAVDFYQLAAVLMLTVFPYALITMVPAWRAATIDPDAVMRQL